MSFLSPLFLFGTLFASAPIIIHLLNRRRFIRIDWGPMKYLKMTIKSNRRRMQIEQWILLAVRTLAVLMLFLAVARPLGSGANLAGFLKVEGRASRVIVIDDTMSMAYETKGSSAFDRAKTAFEKVIHQIGPQDSITVITASNPSEPLVRMASLDEKGKESLINKIRKLTHSQIASQWASTFQSVEQHLSGTPFPVKDVVVISDLWKAGWSEELNAYADRWQKNQISLRFVDVGETPSGNRVLKSLKLTSPVSLVDKPIQLKAIIQNKGETPLQSGQAMLTIDGKVTLITLPEIPADKTVEIPLSATFENAGQHFISLTIPTDQLPDDNSRHIVLNVRKTIQVTLVDGAPGLEPFESETDFLALALSAGHSSWEVTQIDSTDWKTEPLDAPDILVLANVDELSQSRLNELQEMVSLGMGLMIFAGDQCDPEIYNDRFFREGKGVLPARVDQIKETDAKGILVAPYADSPIRLLTSISSESLSRIHPARFMDVSFDEKKKNTRILARWNTPQQSPALIEKKIGLGRVLFWTTSAGKTWGNWPTQASYVLAMRVAASAIATDTAQGKNLIAGQPIHIPLEDKTVPQSSQLKLLGSESVIRFNVNQLTNKDSSVGDSSPKKTSSKSSSLVSHPLTLAGLYRASWKQSNNNERIEKFSVNPDTTDSTQQHLTQKELQQFLGQLPFKLIRFDGKNMDITTRGSELWRYFVFGLLGLVIAESTLAAWINRHR